MVVKPEKPPKWIVSKMAEEGIRSPFYARLFAGMLMLRDQVITGEADRKQSDGNYEAVLASLDVARTAAREIVDAVRTHNRKLGTGEIVLFRPNTVHVSESIDRALQRNTEKFLNSAVRAIKDGLQRLMKPFDVDIGFLFQQQSSFRTALEKLRKKDAVLANYLESTRSEWSERLINARNALHGTWVLPAVRYDADQSQRTVNMVEPMIDGEPVSKFVAEMLDRACCFVKEVTSQALQKHLPEFVSFTEIPVAERRPEFPERFRIALTSGGMPIWRIGFHRLPFDQA